MTVDLVFASTTTGICALHVAIVCWCISKLPHRLLSYGSFAFACVLYGVSLYVFGFIYHAFFFIDATLINAVCCIVFIRAVCDCPLRAAVFLGSAISLCYESARALVLYLVLLGLEINIDTFEADPLLRIVTELLGTLLALSALLVIHRRAGDLEAGVIRPLYVVSLLQPLLIILVVNIWQLPGIDRRSPYVDFVPTLLLIVVEAAVIASTMVLVFALSAERRRAEAAQLESFVQSQHDAFLMRDKTSDAVERIAHDIKNHLTCIQELETSKQIEDHLQGINDELFSLKKYPYTGNGTLDIILNEKATAAHAYNIDFVVLVDFSQGGFLRSVDICAIFGNALDNALQAARQVKEPDKRVVTVKCTVVSGFLTIRVKNYFAGDLKWGDGRPLSKKREWNEHGMGLRSIEHSLSNYGGMMRIESNHDEFSLIVLIPILAKQGHGKSSFAKT